MKNRDYSIINLNQSATLPLETIGGKAQNLGKLATAGFPIPEGYIIPTSTYDKHLNNKHIRNEIKSILALIDYENENDVNEKSNQIKNLILHIPFGSI